MRATSIPSPIRQGRRRLLGSCAIAASLAALAFGGPAMAQVAGTGQVVGGNVNGVISPPAAHGGAGPAGSTQVEVTGAQTIINWTPTDNAPTGGAIDFLPAGNTLEFYGPGQYTVLNRFTDASGGSIGRQVALNGTVNSYIGSRFATGGNAQGGSIWFYNAGGVLIGSTGVLNVGSLVLTANDIDTTGGLFGPGGEIRFRGAAGTSTVEIASGASVNAAYPGSALVAANPGGSYVALVAPRIVQNGIVTTDGSTAYVAAEQADIRINSGLFDINVLVGAQGGTVITHGGRTVGPAHQQGDTDQNRIYMVAIPKNNAVSMLVSGQVGYDEATTAQTEPDGSVVLSAGYNVNGGAIDTIPASGIAANITVHDVFFDNDTEAHASGAFVGQPLGQIPSGPPTTFLPVGPGLVAVDGNATFIGDASASLTVGNGGSGQTIGATGDLTLLSGGANGAPGSATVTINNGGTLVAGGTLTVSADGAFAAATGNGQGGTASFTQNGGVVSAGQIRLSANGLGDNDTGGGAGTGGAATMNLLGGTLNVVSLAVQADGIGGRGSDGTDDSAPLPTPASAGAAGQGGTAAITIGGTAAVTAENMQAHADGQGGDGGDFSAFAGIGGDAGAGASGTGGTATITVAVPTLSVGSLTASANGAGGNGGNVFASSSGGPSTGLGTGGTGGTGQGGIATIDTGIDIPAILTSNARGLGGNGGFGIAGGDGGSAIGGLAQFIVNDFDAGIGNMVVDASAQGGNGSIFSEAGEGGAGGNATGGTGRIEATGANGAVTLNQSQFVTGATGGTGGDGGAGFFATFPVGPAGGQGGDGTGGTLEIAASNGATVTLGSDSPGLVPLSSAGTGGTGGAGSYNGYVEGSIGGAGGNGGAGVGGTVRLLANGGTITSGTDTVAIDVAGTSGSGGTGGNGGGTGNDGAAGNQPATTGGRVIIEIAAGTSPGQINLGATNLTANGDNAGRIELRANGGGIAMASLNAQASGLADPTSNDTDTARAGIFLAANGGAITTGGDMTLTTGSSVGAYAGTDGTIGAGGALTITAGDQIDIRHDGRTGTAATIGADGNITATATNGISAATGSLIDAGGTLSLTASAGPIATDRLHGADIVLSSSGATTVEHAEADNDFIANAASFATGLNSIITGGDIDISAVGAVDLGNSTAGGYVSVLGQAIDFNAIDAGTTVSLYADGAAASGITGGDITAGGAISLTGQAINLSGTVQTPASLSAFTIDGDLAIGLADVAGNIGIFANGDLTGTYRAGGNVNLRATGNATVEADAAGTYLNPSGIPSEGYVFVDAAGNATLTDSSAATMLGVRSGGATSITGGSAGEDIFVLAGTTATLANLTAGDDLDVTSGGAMTISNAATLGTGADDRRVVYELGPSSGSAPPVMMLQIQSSTPDLSNATLSAPTATINAADVTAFSNLSTTAGGTVTGTGLLQSGLTTNISGSDLSLEAVTAGTDAILTATSGGVVATGAIAAGHDVTIGAPGNIAVAELDAGDDVRLDAGGTLSAGAAFAYGTGLDNESDGSNVVATSGGALGFSGDISAANGTTLTGASIAAQAIDAGGDITLTTTSGGSGAIGFTDASAGGDFRATGQSIAFASIDANAVDLIANGATAGAEGISGGAITADDDINLYGNSIVLTGLVQANEDMFATAFGDSVSFGTINAIGRVNIDADADINGTIRSTGNVTLNAGGNVTGSVRADGGGPDPDGFPYEGRLFVDAGGNVTLTDSAAASLFGVHGGGSVTITGATAGEDLFVNAGSTATLSGVTAGDDLTVEAAGAISVTNSGTTGAGADEREIFYAACCSNPLFFVLQTTDVDPDGSNVALTSSAGNIVASDISAFNALTANAAGTLSGTGLLQAGSDIQLIAAGAVNIADADAGNSLTIDAASIGFDDLSAGDSAGLFATGAVAGGTITAGADIQISGASIAVAGVQSDGSLNAQANGGGVAIAQADIAGFVDVTATGTIGGAYTAGGDIRLSTTGSIDASVNALGGYLDPSTDNPAAGNAYLDAGGNIVLADSSAADMLGIRAGGSASVTAATAGEDALVIAGTTANLSELSAGDDIDVRAGGAITANDVRATGDGPDGFALFYSSGSGFTIGQGEGSSSLDGADIDLNSSSGAINASGLSAGDDILLTAATAIAVNGGGTLGLGVTGGDSSIRTQSATATLGSLSAADDVVVNATGAVGVTAPLLAGRDIAITAGSADLATLMTPAGDRVDTLRADGNVGVTASGTIDGGAITAGGNVALDGATGVTVDAIASQGATSLTSDAGAIMVGALASGGAVDASGDSVEIRGSGSLVFANLVTDVGDATVRTDGDLSVTNGDVAGLATLGSDNARLTVTALTAGGTRLEAFGPMALTNVSVDGDISVYGQSALQIDGVVTGESISIASTDISIGSNARVGTAGVTGSLGITNNDNSRQTFIGGDGTGNGYNIDAGELSRIYGSDIAIHASEVDTSNFRFIGSGPPDVVIDDFTMTAGGSTSNLGANGSLTIDTSGTARVIGDVALTGMSDANTLNILADDSFEVVLGEGSIRLSGASSDAPAGMLRIASEDVIVATLAAIDDVAAATTTDAIEERLAQNDGIISDDGALYAGGINVSVFNGFYVQNSGAGTDYGERRGLIFGAGGLTVNTEGSGTRLVINGVHLGPQGPVTGLDTIPLLTVSDFEERSTFNGCVIANTGACVVVVFPNESGFPVQDVIEEESNDDDGDGTSLPTALITMRAIDPLTGEPLLDDPVTGAGNDDLWTPPAE